MTTFSELGIPFPLFEGEIDGSQYAGIAACATCAREGRHTFRLAVGCALMLDCPSCQTANGLSAYDRSATPCRACGRVIEFPRIASAEIRCCYACLREGKAAITTDTELGMISWDQAFKGVTNGVPGLDHPDFEMVPIEGDWAGARLPQELMFELLRTPNYSTWQGERWLFSCKNPMVYIGSWDRDAFARNSPDGDGRALFERIVPEYRTEMWEGRFGDSTSYYVFKCKRCGELRCHWDMA